MLLSDLKTAIDLCDIHLHMDFKSLLYTKEIVDIALTSMRRSAMTNSIVYRCAIDLKNALCELHNEYIAHNT